MWLNSLFFKVSKRMGGIPRGTRQERILRSPQFRSGSFQNASDTPQLAEGYTYRGVMQDYFFKRRPRRKPAAPLPAVRTDLKTLPRERDWLVWFGHSSYLMQLDGKRFLVDPVFSGNASPLRGTNKAFAGTDLYSTDDLPPVDCLLITHDHYDHLDYLTVRDMRNSVGSVYTGLGVGAHLERWGFHPRIITELDWGESIAPFPGFALHAAPARHFSGRGLQRNNTLWCSFVLLTPTRKIYIGGDSGWDTHFSELGRRFGPFDLAILENGQYNSAWKYIHALPDEVPRAAEALRARYLLPVHWGKFAMALHDWDEPMDRFCEAMGAQSKGAKEEETKAPGLVIPRIGEVVYLDELERPWPQWWKDVPETT